MDESLDQFARRANLPDDRKEYRDKKKYGKNYKQFMSMPPDDRKEYRDRMKYGKK